MAIGGFVLGHAAIHPIAPKPRLTPRSGTHYWAYELSRCGAVSP